MCTIRPRTWLQKVNRIKSNFMTWSKTTKKIKLYCMQDDQLSKCKLSVKLLFWYCTQEAWLLLHSIKTLLSCTQYKCMPSEIWFLWQDCYLLDQGGIKIFVWKGKKASKTERTESLKKAEVRKDHSNTLEALIKYFFLQWASFTNCVYTRICA